MSKAVAKLKDDARKHEQKEEWEKAIDAYVQVIKTTSGGEGEVDLPLFNRVGDLYVRLGKPSDAVNYYEQAADQYAEAGLYNNAIALCNKALRYLPNRLEIFRKLGQFSAAQGFLTDARRWYLEYAERQIKAGKLDDAFAALEDFAKVHEDAEIRELLGRQYKAYARNELAVTALQRAYQLRTQAGEHAAAAGIKAEILEIEPSALVEEQKEAPAAHSPSWHPPDSSDFSLPGMVDIGLQSPAGAAFGTEAPEAAALEMPNIELQGIDMGQDDAAGDLDSTGLDVTGFDSNLADIDTGAQTEQLAGLEGFGMDLSSGGDDDIGTQDVGLDLPLMDTGTDDLPTFDVESEGDGDSGGFDLPLEVYHDEDEDHDPLPLIDMEPEAEEEESDPLPLVDFSAPEPETVEEEPEPEPEPPPSAKAKPVKTPKPEAAPGRPTFQKPAPKAQSPKPKTDFIDLGALIAEDDEEDSSSRFVVAEQAPTGDEERDFAEMLTQFKQKVSEHISVDDAAAHYDLGLAFKEMGLVDEAISEFQTAMKGGEARLKVYEELGQCFVMKQQYNVAVTVLKRALQIPVDNEEDMIGVYYSLGRSHEGLGQKAEAKSAFERVIGLDIGFQDAMQRLAQL